MTIDHVNPEAPWPELERLAGRDRGRGLELGAAPRPSIPGFIDAATGSTRRCCRACSGVADSLGPRPRGRVGARARRRRACRSSCRRDAARRVERAPASSARTRSCACFRARGEERQRVFARRRRASARGERRRRHLRRHAEHPVHQRLLLPLRLLRVLEGEARRRTCAATRTSSRTTRSCGARSRRGIAARPRSACRAGSIPAFDGDYYASVVRAIKDAVPGPARARVQRARGLAGRGDARRAAARLPRAAARRGARARCRGRPRRSSTTRCAR